MKSVLIYNMFDYGLKYYVVDGDWSRFEDIYVNQATRDKAVEALQMELSGLMWDEENEGKDRYTPEDKFPIQAVKDDAIVVTCGFIP